MFFPVALNNKITDNKILAYYYCNKRIFSQEKGVKITFSDLFIYLFNPATQVYSHSGLAEEIFAYSYQWIHSKVLPSMWRKVF